MNQDRRSRIEVDVTDEPISSTLASGLADRLDGALVTFTGVVRSSTDGREVVGLEYEAYREMAAAELRKLAEHAAAQWSLGGVIIVHRVGSLTVGESSVVVAVTAPHRSEAFDACEFLIDTLKKKVPIWKKELFSDGTSSWVDHP